MGNETEFDVSLDASDLLEQEVLLDDVISNTHLLEEATEKNVPLLGSYVCKLFFFAESNEYFVGHPLENNKTVLLHGSTVEIHENLDNSDVLVVFDGGDINKPIVTGFVNKFIKARNLSSQAVSVKKDKEETLVFEADKEIVLKCGKSSITLTKAGKVLIRGAYLLSRSSGVNRIKGGSVHLN